MAQYANLILWIYIVLLVAGGLVGFLKAGSKMSLIMSVGFAATLCACALNMVSPAGTIADVLLIVLLVFFAMRLTKSKKFMPNGLMLILTIAALALRHIR